MMDLISLVDGQGVAIIGGIIALILAVLGIRQSGKRSADQKHEIDTLKAQVKSLKTAKEVREDVEILDDVGLAARARKWVRPNSK